MNRQTQVALTVTVLVAVGVVSSVVTWLVVRDDAKTASSGSFSAEVFAGQAKPEAPPAEDVQKLVDEKKNNAGERPREGDTAPAVGAPNPPPPDQCDANGPPTVFAEWRFEPQSISEARGKAKAVVFGEVVAVEAGPDVVVEVPGEPGGEVRTPTTHATLMIERSFKGGAKPGSTIPLTQLGSDCIRVAEDPPFQKGEKALLMLEDGPRGRMQTIAPEGRYRQGPDGGLNPVIDNEVTAKLKGKRPEEAGREIG